MRPIGVLLVDDHGLVRTGLRELLERREEFQVAGEAEDGSSAVDLYKTARPDIVLMDVELPGLNGIETTAEIVGADPKAKIVILSMHDDDRTVVTAMQAGVRGFVLKGATADEVFAALRTVAQGGSYLSPRVSDRLLERIQKGTLQSGFESPLLHGLSRREVQVLRLIAEGKSSKEIASVLGLETETIRSYRKTMMKKLGVDNAAGLTRVAIAANLVACPSPGSPPTQGGGN